MRRTAILLILSSVLTWGCQQRPATPVAAPAAKATPEDSAARQAALDAQHEKTDIKVTLDEFNRVRPGMTLEQVEGVFGCEPASDTNRYTPANADTYTRPALTTIYRWENPDQSWCELEFVEKKLETKRHQDLKPTEAYKGTAYTLPELRHGFGGGTPEKG